MRSAAALSVLMVLVGCNQQQMTDEVTTQKIETVPSVPSEELKPSLQARGTEPFWSVEVQNGQLKYTSPEYLDGAAFPANTTRLQPGWRFAGALAGKRAVLTIELSTCRDGMSDTVYPYKASFIWGDVARQGCARER